MKYIKKISLIYLIIVPLATHAMESGDNSIKSDEKQISIQTMDLAAKNEAQLSHSNDLIDDATESSRINCRFEGHSSHKDDSDSYNTSSSDSEKVNSRKIGLRRHKREMMAQDVVTKDILCRWRIWLNNPEGSFKFYQEMQNESEGLRRCCYDQTQRIEELNQNCRSLDQSLNVLETKCQEQNEEIERLKKDELWALLETAPELVFKRASESLKNMSATNQFAVQTTRTSRGAPLGSNDPYVIKAFEEMEKVYETENNDTRHQLNLRPLEKHIRNNQSILSFTKKDVARTAIVTLPCIAITAWLMNWLVKK